MNELTSLLEASRDILLEHRYLILFTVAIFEGTWTTLAAGVLSATGFFWAPSAFLILIVSETIGGYFWYGIGYYFGGKSLDWLVHRSPSKQALLATVRRHSERAAALVVFVVKVTYSITTPTLVLIGSLKYDLRKFSVVNFVGSVVWVCMLFGLGYLLGDQAREYVPLLKSFGHAVVLLMMLGIALWILHGVGTAVLRQVNRSYRG